MWQVSHAFILNSAHPWNVYFSNDLNMYNIFTLLASIVNIIAVTKENRYLLQPIRQYSFMWRFK